MQKHGIAKTSKTRILQGLRLASVVFRVEMVPPNTEKSKGPSSKSPGICARVHEQHPAKPKDDIDEI